MKKTAITLICILIISLVTPGNASATETVGVIGTGDMGDSLGPRFAELGYQVVYGSRRPESDKV